MVLKCMSVFVKAKKRESDFFAGIVISRKGSGIHETFTVRRIASGVGVERVFPVHSPLIDKVEVDRESITMRAECITCVIKSVRKLTK